MSPLVRYAIAKASDRDSAITGCTVSAAPIAANPDFLAQPSISRLQFLQRELAPFLEPRQNRRRCIEGKPPADALRILVTHARRAERIFQKDRQNAPALFQLLDKGVRDVLHGTLEEHRFIGSMLWGTVHQDATCDRNIVCRCLAQGAFRFASQISIFFQGDHGFGHACSQCR